MPAQQQEVDMVYVPGGESITFFTYRLMYISIDEISDKNKIDY